MTLLKAGTKNPLGSADLGYSERSEYTSAETLKERLRTILASKSAYLKLVRETSYQIYDSNATETRIEIEELIKTIVKTIYFNKSITKENATKLCAGKRAMADQILNSLRAQGVVEIAGAKRGAKWVFLDSWVYHDHEVAGLA